MNLAGRIGRGGGLALLSLACLAGQPVLASAQYCAEAEALAPQIEDARQLLIARNAAAALELLREAESSITTSCGRYWQVVLSARALLAQDDVPGAISEMDAGIANAAGSNDQVAALKNERTRLKLTAQRDKLAKDRKTKRLVKVSVEEAQALDFAEFKNGIFDYESAARANSVLGRLGKLLVLAATDDSIQAHESMIQNRDWAGLARYAIRDGKAGQTLDIHYFYLATAASGLGLDDAARIYAQRSTGGTNVVPCARGQYAGERFRSACGSYSMPQAARQLLTNLELAAERRAEEEREGERIAMEQKRLAEEAKGKAALQRRRQQEAEAQQSARLESLKNRYSEDVVQAILARKIVLGMDPSAVKEAAGSPLRTEELGGAEMWYYQERRVVFNDGLVSFIEEL